MPSSQSTLPLRLAFLAQAHTVTGGVVGGDLGVEGGGDGVEGRGGCW